MPRKHRPHKVKWTWVELGRKTYVDNGVDKIMIFERCSVCGHSRFRPYRQALQEG